MDKVTEKQARIYVCVYMIQLSLQYSVHTITVKE